MLKNITVAAVLNAAAVINMEKHFWGWWGHQLGHFKAHFWFYLVIRASAIFEVRLLIGWGQRWTSILKNNDDYWITFENSPEKLIMRLFWWRYKKYWKHECDFFLRKLNSILQINGKRWPKCTWIKSKARAIGSMSPSVEHILSDHVFLCQLIFFKIIIVGQKIFEKWGNIVPKPVA